MGRAGGPNVIDMPTCANDAVEIARTTTVNNSERMAGMIRMAFPPAFDLSLARFCSAAADCADCMARFSDSTAESPTCRGDIVRHRNMNREGSGPMRTTVSAQTIRHDFLDNTGFTPSAGREYRSISLE